MATGSSNGCLVAYLIKYRYFGTEKINMRVEQGYEINRHSLIHIQAEVVESKINVCVGGKIESIASGSNNRGIRNAIKNNILQGGRREKGIVF
ncbi:PhzF family phenazine biosynthesis protein [Bacillus mycoides]